MHQCFTPHSHLPFQLNRGIRHFLVRVVQILTCFQAEMFAPLTELPLFSSWFHHCQTSSRFVCLLFIVQGLVILESRAGLLLVLLCPCSASSTVSLFHFNTVIRSLEFEFTFTLKETFCAYLLLL